jgi:hypothetical protein
MVNLGTPQARGLDPHGGLAPFRASLRFIGAVELAAIAKEERLTQVTLKTESTPRAALRVRGTLRPAEVDPPWRRSRYAWPGLIILVDRDGGSAYNLREKRAVRERSGPFCD